MINLLFNYYENKYVRDYLYYINNKYALSNYRALSDYILNNYYEIIYSKIKI